MEIRLDDLRGVQIKELLQGHLDGMALHSPPESIHALDLESLRAPEIKFWTAWQGEDLLGCGALKHLNPETVELKSMRTSKAHLRKGVASKLLEHMINYAKDRSYRKIKLETGSNEAFAAARKMYTRYGFNYCPPFVDYKEDPYSVFMHLKLPE